MKLCFRFLFLLLCGCAMSLSAEAEIIQYGQDLHGDDYSVRTVEAGKGNWYMVAKENSDLFFCTDLANHAPASIAAKYGSFKTAYSEVGYFFFDDNNTITSQEALAFDENGMAIIPDIKAGQKIGFWSSAIDGTTYYSMTFANNGKQFSSVLNGRDTWTDGAENRRVFAFALGNKGTEVLGVLVEAEAAHAPLPGVLLSMLLGIGGIGAGSRLRKKSN